jgi:uncharacterized protein involved in response to NO
MTTSTTTTTLTTTTQQAMLKTADTSAIVVAMLSFFKAIPWPEIAAFLAAVYTLVRLLEWAYDRFIKPRTKGRNHRRRITD